MPFTKKTLTDCLQSLADRHESNGVLPTSSVVLVYWTRLLNKGVNYCADKMRINKSTTVTVASKTVALPDDFLVMNRVFNASENELKMIDPDDIPNQTGYAYWITGDQFNGFYLNTPTDGVYTIEYSFKPAEMVNGTDKCIIPDIEAPVAYAYAMIRKGESDPFEDANDSLLECDSRLAEMQSAKVINENFNGFIING